MIRIRRSIRIGSVLLLLLASLVLAPVASAQGNNDHLWMEPAQPVAGQATRLIFIAGLVGAPRPEVVVEGGDITIVLRVECVDVCFSARVPTTVEAMIPALDAGDYTLLTVDGGSEPGIPADAEPVALGTLTVSASSDVERVLPAQGFWSPVAQPGSGLFLERRGDLLAVASYSFREATSAPSEAAWTLGTGSWSGDSVPLVMNSFAGGDCLGCEDHTAPMLAGIGVSAIRLRFESARRMWVDVAARSTVAMTSLPYGTGYLPVTLADTVDATFGTLPLPDLRGRWLFTIEGPAGTGTVASMQWDHVSIETGSAAFGSGENFVCRAATEARRAGCEGGPGLQFSPPLPEPYNSFHGSGWFVPLGDIEEDRMRGVIEADGQTWRIRGVRTAPPPGD